MQDLTPATPRGRNARRLPRTVSDATAALVVKIATFNINSVRARYDLLIGWLTQHQPDVLCLQETKVADHEFATLELQMLGYAVAMAGQPSYNGVAIVSRLPMTDIEVGLAGDPADAERRFVAATIASVRVMSVYVPNGRAVGSPAFREKLRFLERLHATLQQSRTRYTDAAVCGDFNIAADERDVYDPALYRGKVHFHPDEHAALQRIFALGLIDGYRLHHEEGGRFSWWDYRAGAFRFNQGLRLDYILLSQPLARRCRAATMDVEARRLVKPSDHIPVVVELEDGPATPDSVTEVVR
jgi:exodeoxyribonuclease-3